MSIDPMSTEEIDDFINACNDENDKMVAYLGVYAGMRAGEIAHIQKNWVRFQERVIRIPSQQSCYCGECKKKRGDVWTPKTRQSSRTIHVVEPALMILLKQYFTLHDKFQLTSRTAIHGRVKKIAHRAGITRKVTAHSLRHTFGTVLARKFVSESTIMSEMGHARSDTVRIYIHFVGRDAEKEMKEKW